MQEIITEVVKLKMFVLCCCITIPLIAAFATFQITRTRMSHRHATLWYLFYNLDGKSIVHITMLYLLLMVICSSLLLREAPESIHALLFASCFMLSVLSAPTWKSAWFLCINEGIVAIGILILTALAQYARIVTEDPRYLWVYVVGTICMVLYAGYIFVYGSLQTIRGKQKKTER